MSTNAPWAFVLLGVESSGNHMFLSLFTHTCWRGVRLLGTDLAGWDDGAKRDHYDGLFQPVWVGEQRLEAVAKHRAFVTGRSLPCDQQVPDYMAFLGQCEDAGYHTMPVVLIRDQNIVQASTLKRPDLPLKDSWAKWRHLDPLFAQTEIDYRFISYEAVVCLRGHYFRHWLRQLDRDLTIEDGWLDRIVDANAKHVPIPEVAA